MDLEKMKERRVNLVRTMEQARNLYHQLVGQVAVLNSLIEEEEGKNDKKKDKKK